MTDELCKTNTIVGTDEVDEVNVLQYECVVSVAVEGQSRLEELEGSRGGVVEAFCRQNHLILSQKH